MGPDTKLPLFFVLREHFLAPKHTEGPKNPTYQRRVDEVQDPREILWEELQSIELDGDRLFPEGLGLRGFFGWGFRCPTRLGGGWMLKRPANRGKEDGVSTEVVV